ncbi:MAG: hypothetical protein R3E83_19335 [Burkholderiaceae bacterium]
MADADLERRLRERFERGLPDRVVQLKTLRYSRVIGGHHFAEASTECLELYRDGYAIGCVVCGQAVIEAMLKFVGKWNGVPYQKPTEELIGDLESAGLVMPDPATVARLAWRDRNDFHHLNPRFASIDLWGKARGCVDAVCALEDDIFGVDFLDGALIPRKPAYWDYPSDGKIVAFVRNLDI